jgi:hypothetical protein
MPELFLCKGFVTNKLAAASAVTAAAALHVKIPALQALAGLGRLLSSAPGGTQQPRPAV